MSNINPSLNTQSGFIKLILLVIIAILVLGYFNIDLKSLAEKPSTKNNIGYVVSLGSKAWNNYLSKPVLYFWNNIFVGILWEAFVNNFDLIKQGKPPINFTPTNDNSQLNINKVINDLKGLEPTKVSP